MSKNAIIGGFSNSITNGEYCSVINGSNNIIRPPAGSTTAVTNTHIVGKDITETRSNVFWAGCLNGLHCIGDVVAYSTSDIRLKDNIKPIGKCLEKVCSLDSIYFEWNNKQETYTGKDIGLIAQQVEKIAPEIVQTRSTGYKAMKYEKMIPLLVGAIQEQSDQIDSLEKQIKDLQSKNR